LAYIGQQFRIEGDPTGRVYTCNDTGSAVHGLHRDIWFFSSAEGWQWQLSVGPRAVLEIVQ
jgi:3D (Asp-Asp-Asp) domain-containing protein